MHFNFYFRDCPVCREGDTDIRNLYAEKSIVFLSIPCEYKQYGCKEEIQFSEKEVVSSNFYVHFILFILFFKHMYVTYLNTSRNLYRNLIFFSMKIIANLGLLTALILNVMTSLQPMMSLLM